MRTRVIRMHGLLCIIGMAALLGVISASRVGAQWKFQARYGGMANDEGKNGVRKMSSGGYVACGESNSFGMDYDIYVVRTDAQGTLRWSKTYDFSGNDYATDIEQTSDGHLVITGVARNNRGCTQDEVFLLKIDSADGGVLWAKIYGGVGYEVGMDVIQVQGSTDLAVAGYTNSFGAGLTSVANVDDYDGFIIRTDAAGNIQWGRTYGSISNDFFYTLTNTGGIGDIVAAGSSFGYGNNEQIFAVRINGTGVAQWGTAYGKAGNERAMSVQSFGNGDLIFGGTTNSWGAGGDDAFLMRTNSTGRNATLRTFGTANSELGSYVREIKAGPDVNNLIFAGSASNNPNGFGFSDLYLIKTPANLANGPAFTRLYGGPNAEWGYSVDHDPADNGFIADGWTFSFNAMGWDLYLVKTNRFGFVNCQDTVAKDTTMYFPSDSVRVDTARVAVAKWRQQCAYTPGIGMNNQWNIICKPVHVDSLPPKDTMPKDTLKDTIITPPPLRQFHIGQADQRSDARGAIAGKRLPLALPAPATLGRSKPADALPDRRTINRSGAERGASSNYQRGRGGRK